MRALQGVVFSCTIFVVIVAAAVYQIVTIYGNQVDQTEVNCAGSLECLACEQLQVPNYGVYSAGQCFVFVVPPFLPKTAPQACEHLNASRRGRAMWIPPTVMKQATDKTIELPPSTYFMSTLYTPTIGETVVINGSNVTLDVGPYSLGEMADMSFYRQSDASTHWYSRPALNNLQLFHVENHNYDRHFTMELFAHRQCWMFGVQHLGGPAHHAMRIAQCVDGVHSGRGHVCFYELKPPALIEIPGYRLKDELIIGQFTTNSYDECYRRMRDCGACNSLAYSSKDGDCQLYIPDKRHSQWEEVLIQNDSYRLFANH